MKRFGLIILVLVVAAVLCAVLFGPRTSPAVSLRIIRITNDPVGVPTVLFQVTNGSRSAFACTYQAQVLTNGFWTTPDMVMGKNTPGSFGTQSLPGQSAFEASVSVPAPGMTWRVLVFYSEPAGTLRARVDDLFQKVRLPFRVNRKAFVVGQEFRP
jgi:hypothetical protein